MVRRTAVAGAVVVVAAAGSPLGVAAATDGPAEYKACLSASKTLYNVLVNPRSGPSCRSGDKVIRWNQQGPRGPQGPQGPEGPPGADAEGGFNTVTTNRQVIGGGVGATGLIATADCPDGSVATGGGFAVGTFEPYTVVYSTPVVETAHPVGWQVKVQFASNTTAESSLTAYVVCVSSVADPV